MKKFFFYLFCFIFILGCSKKEVINLSHSSDGNTIELISDGKGMSYIGKMQMGHSANGCNGCAVINGTKVHLACTGYGTECSSNVAFTLTATREHNDYYATVLNPDEFTDYDVFLMPERSLYIVGSNGEFLNIPEQTVYKDEETGTFIFYDIFFSEGQMFENK